MTWNVRSFLREAGVIAATTVGAGMFGLPYVFWKSGWLVGIFYLLGLSFVVAGSHVLYWRALEQTGEKRRLLGMARDFLGKFWYRVGLLSVLAGLILALVIYLILGSSFVRLLWPSADGNFAMFLFWLASVAPLFFEKRVVGLELAGVFLMAVIILLIFLSAPQLSPQTAPPAVGFGNLFLPFGVVLFSLAGWTAVEPLFADSRGSGVRGEEENGNGHSRSPWVSFFAGTFLSAFLYALFVWGIFGSAAVIAPDTVSGLASWPFWKLAALGVLGVFALWTSYMPIGLETKNSLVRDLGWKPFWGTALVALLPPLLVLAGLSDFPRVVGLAGGVFLALQYILIILVGRRVLGLKASAGRAEKIFYDLAVGAFSLAAVYEFYYFIAG